jgi:hypothetical protein
MVPGEESAGGEGATGQSETIHIASDMLPPGIKEGDCLHCTGMDENGCQFELEKGEGPNTGESWEEGFRRDMSAQNPTAEAS